MKETLFHWIEQHDEKAKREYIRILKDENVYDLFYPGNIGRRQKNPRKRQAPYTALDDYKKLSNGKNAGSKRPRRQHQVLNEIVEIPNFEILKYYKNEHLKTKLLVFPASDRKYCYEYYWCQSVKFFVCCICQQRGVHMTAKIIKRNGKDVVQLNRTQHICQIREYKFIIEKPNFEAFSYYEKGIAFKRLILILDSSRTMCYEYSCQSGSKIYYCCGCVCRKHWNGAKICQKEDGTEFVMLKSSNHVCEPRKYNPDKYGEKEIVEADNFKVFENTENGRDKSKLVIFTSPDKTNCYEYFWNNSGKNYLCIGCRNKKKSISANVCQNSDGSEYLKLSKMKHICEPQEYNPDKFDASRRETVDNSNFKIFNYNHNGIETSRLIVFCKTNKNLCHEYYLNKKFQKYICVSCPRKNFVSATVIKSDGLKDYLSLSLAQHVCNLREFDPEKYKDDVIIDKSMYEITSNLREYNILTVFSSEEKKFYYKFCYNISNKTYYCSKCSSSNFLISAKIQNEGKDNEVLYVSNQRPICELLEYCLSIEKNLVMAPNFQLVKRKYREKIMQRMVVFTNEEKTKCYEYTWIPRDKTYICRSCENQHKIRVSSKCVKNNENEECIELGERPHKCKPIQFVPENITTRIVKSPDFKLFESFYHQRKLKKLAILDPEKNNFGYVYSYIEQNKKYVCPRCSHKNKFVWGKVLQDEHGESYVELSETEHVCDLQKI